MKIIDDKSIEKPPYEGNREKLPDKKLKIRDIMAAISNLFTERQKKRTK